MQSAAIAKYREVGDLLHNIASEIATLKVAPEHEASYRELFKTFTDSLASMTDGLRGLLSAIQAAKTRVEPPQS